MAKIETYSLSTLPLSLSDMLIGTEVGGPIPNATKNFSLGDLLDLFRSNTSPLNSKGDLYTFSTVNTRLGVGSNGQFLAADSTSVTGLKWVPAPTGTSPLISKGDIFTYDTANARLPLGVNGQILAVDTTQVSGLKWINAPSGTSPLTTKGDIYSFSTTNTRLGVGSNGQILSADNTTATGLKWINAPSGTSPLTTKGDLYTFDTVNTRLSVGTNGQILSADSTSATGLKWINAPSGTSPLTSKGDIYVFGTTNTRLPIGANGQILSANSASATGLSWINAPSTSPLTTKGDLYTFDTTNARLSVGTNGQILSADSTSATGLRWINAPSGTSPLTTKGDIYVFGTTNTRLPIGADSQVLVADSTQPTGLRWTSSPTGTGYYAQYFSYLTQNATTNNVGKAMIFETLDMSNGVTVVTDGTNLTKITFANAGKYNLQFSTQLQSLSTAPEDVYIWLRKNGTTSAADVVGSTGVVGMEARKGPTDPYHIIAGWNFLLDINANDFYQIVWATTNVTAVEIRFYASTSDHPSTASTIFTVTQPGGGTGSGGSGTPAAPLNSVQFNNAGSFGGDSNLYWDNVNKRLGIGTSYLPGRANVFLDNVDYTNINGSNSHIILNNSNTTGQNVLTSIINNNIVAKWRTDYVGSNAFVSTGGKHDFFTGGDFQVGSTKMTIFNNGNVKINNPGIGGINTDGGYKLQVNGTVSFTNITNSTQVNVLGYNSSTGEISYQSAGSGGSGTPNGPFNSVQFNNAGSFGGDSNLSWDDTNKWLGIGTSSPQVKLDIVGNNNNRNTAQFGTIGLQSYSVNNCWFGDNNYFNGTQFIRRDYGFAGLFYFLGSEGQFRFGDSNGAGTPIDNGYSGYGLVSLKTNLNGTFAVGDMSHIAGDYTGARFKVDDVGDVFMPNISSASSTYVLGYNVSTGKVNYQIAGGGGPGGRLGISLPVPTVILNRGTVGIQALDRETGGALTNLVLNKYPTVIASDLTDELFSTYQIFLEMVHFKRKGGKHTSTGGYVKRSGYVVEPDLSFDGNGDRLWPVPWPTNFFTRNQSPCRAPAVYTDNAYIPVTINRPNWYPIDTINQNVPVWQYLNSRFYGEDIEYRDQNGNIDYLGTYIPVYGNRAYYKNTVANGNRFAYSTWYNSLYVAFRYIAWDELANGERGQIISGPLSRVVRVSHKDFPFRYDFNASSIHGVPCAGISNKYIGNQLQCFFETRLP